MTPKVRLALLGCGNVGGAFAELLTRRRSAMAERMGIEFEIVGIAVADVSKPRPAAIDRGLLTDDAVGLVGRADVDVVVELVGGIDPARSLVEAALKSGRPVVTGNKALLAHHGGALAALAEANGVDLLYEAAVGGAIPVIRPLRESLAGEGVRRVMGIVNGTTNYILTQMTERGVGYDEVLAEAQAQGLAERDPRADVEGDDAAAKAAILASLAFSSEVVDEDVSREGITSIREIDVTFAGRLGYEVKLLAVAEVLAEGLSVRVHPMMVPRSHPLASVRGAFNAVFVEGESAGELMFYGRGAGGAPTASAILGDVIDAARNRLSGTHAPAPGRRRMRMVELGELRSAFYISLDVVDRPAVLAAVAAVFGKEGVSIRAMEQVGLGEEARLIFLTHLASERAVAATLEQLRGLEVVDSVGAVIRVLVEDEAEG